MEIFELATIYIFLGGAVGMVLRSQIALSLKPLKIIRSKNIFIRYISRCAIFNVHLFLSFLITPAAISRLLEYMKESGWPQEDLRVIYLLSCIPLAILLYVIDYRFIVKMANSE